MKPYSLPAPPHTLSFFFFFFGSSCKCQRMLPLPLSSINSTLHTKPHQTLKPISYSLLPSHSNNPTLVLVKMSKLPTIFVFLVLLLSFSYLQVTMAGSGKNKKLERQTHFLSSFFSFFGSFKLVVFGLNPCFLFIFHLYRFTDLMDPNIRLFFMLLARFL